MPANFPIFELLGLIAAAYTLSSLRIIKQYERGVSFFLVDNAPGEGPGLHVHPYSETWIVRSGVAEFTVAGRTTRAGAGG